MSAVPGAFVVDISGAATIRRAKPRARRLPAPAAAVPGRSLPSCLRVEKDDDEAPFGAVVARGNKAAAPAGLITKPSAGATDSTAHARQMAVVGVMVPEEFVFCGAAMTL